LFVGVASFPPFQRLLLTYLCVTSLNPSAFYNFSINLEVWTS
jgi:hypothetical protein